MGGGYRHYGLVLIVVVTSLWIASPRDPGRAMIAARLMLALSLLMSIPMALTFVRDDITRSFSGSKEMAEYLMRHRLEGERIAAHPPAQSEAVLAWLPDRTFWYPGLERSGSYMSWGRAYRVAQRMSVRRAASAASRHYDGSSWLFVSSQPLVQPGNFNLELLYTTQRPLMLSPHSPSRTNDEQYWLYRSRHAAR